METRSNGNRKNQAGASVYSYTRWSSDGQADGDSERRQVQMAENWCARRGLSLTGLEKDEGISAWKGRNQREGSGLSRLLKIIKPGDFLLVEDSDRLSRQNWFAHMTFLGNIVSRGVTVVTLANGNEIDQERFKCDPACFLPAILRAHLGHDENQKKSARIRASWEARKIAMSKGQAAKIHLPCWLGWDGKADRPVLLQSNAKIVRQMFELALKGLGCQTIARTLHKAGHILMAGDRRLSLSAHYVWRTLRNKLTIGTSTYVQPPMPGLYPAVVDERTFYAVQRLLQENKRQTAPRAHSESNLFTGLARCCKCGGTLCRFTQCRNGKSYQYLVCSETLHKYGKCGLTGMRYDLLEASFLALLANSDLVRQAMAGNEKDRPLLADSLAGELADAENQIIKFLELIKDDPRPSPALYKALKEAEAKARELGEQIDAERVRQIADTPARESYEEFQMRFGGRMQQQQYRAEVKAILRSMVDRLVVDAADKTYEVHFRGASEPVIVGVSTKPAGWIFRDLRASPVHPIG